MNTSPHVQSNWSSHVHSFLLSLAYQKFDNDKEEFYLGYVQVWKFLLDYVCLCFSSPDKFAVSAKHPSLARKTKCSEFSIRK